ncbi:trafficking protein-like protein particle complex subunit 2 [Aureobasidium pullulans]|uniref:Trafficking protein-like protein particle complex subunit 2 n=1 Tax=Aureobasidium pullulans TaxID=5580 RepID=A0AB74JD25_AURPU|nr:trafficking protein-like protein particle complex subunit 2 [Aureobasidium pullulans]
MSYYFTIIGTRDNPLFEHEFGTSKAGGDGIARFRDEARHMNQFIVHSSLDSVEEVQWGNNGLYLKNIDRFQNNHIHCFITGGNVKFMLLMNPDPSSTTYSTYPAAAPPRQHPSVTARQSTLLANNPGSAQTEEAVRQFMTDVYEAWVKCIMNPFYTVNAPVTSPVFRGRVAGAAKKYL